MYNFLNFFPYYIVIAPVHAPDWGGGGGGLAALTPPGVLAQCKQGQIRIIKLEEKTLRCRKLLHGRYICWKVWVCNVMV